MAPPSAHDPGREPVAATGGKSHAEVVIEATVAGIRALLELAEADRAAEEPSPREARNAVARRVPRVLLDAYELLLEIGRTPAVVAIDKGACSGCHVRLPTMLEARARRSATVHRCPRCRRMLYAPEFVGEASGSDTGKGPRGGVTAVTGRRS